MKKFIRFLAFALLTFGVFSCGKNSYKNYYFNEMYCLNPWESFYESDSVSQDQLVESIAAYLNSENITVNNITFDFDSSLIEYCYACHCTTGRIIVADVKGATRRKMSRLNFYR